MYNTPFYVDLEGGCCETKRIIYLRMLINYRMLCIEVDGHQQKRYIKYDKNMRYDNLFMAFSGKYIFIRYSPDQFIDKYNTSKSSFFQIRMDLLDNDIETHIQILAHGLNTDLIVIHNLLYNENLYKLFF